MQWRMRMFLVIVFWVLASMICWQKQDSLNDSLSTLISSTERWRAGDKTFGNYVEEEVTLSTGALEFTRTVTNKSVDLLWLSLTNDSQSWGKNLLHRRNIDDFLTLVSQQVEPTSVSVGLLTSSEAEYKAYIKATRSYQFARTIVIFHKGFNSLKIDRAHRKDKAVQFARRSELAKQRNYLTLRALKDETHLLWTDADVFKLDTGIVKRMIRHATVRMDVGMITARCSAGGNDNYDHNAWRGTRKGPRGWDLNDAEIKSGELKEQGQHHVSELIKGSSDDDLISLNVVGATILYIRPALIWQGLTFPTQFVVGTRWQKNGWDGIESEGLCYNARHMVGGSCAVMGGSWHVEHTKN